MHADASCACVPGVIRPRSAGSVSSALRRVVEVVVRASDVSRNSPPYPQTWHRALGRFAPQWGTRDCCHLSWSGDPFYLPVCFSQTSWLYSSLLHSLFPPSSSSPTPPSPNPVVWALGNPHALRLFLLLILPHVPWRRGSGAVVGIERPGRAGTQAGISGEKHTARYIEFNYFLYLTHKPDGPVSGERLGLERVRDTGK